MSLQLFNAIVVRNTDPDLNSGLRGAVYFQCDGLLEDQEYPIPALPLFQHEYFSVPNIDDVIEIEIDLSLERSQPRWRCVVLNLTDELPDEFKKDYPEVRGIRTKSGHFLIFNDTVGSELIQLTHKIGTYLKLDTNGDYVENVKKNKIVDIVGDEDTTTLGNRVHEALSHVIKSSGTIQLGSSSATENLILGIAFSLFYNLHTHTSKAPGSPTSPPIVPMTALQMSSKHFTEL